MLPKQPGSGQRSMMTRDELLRRGSSNMPQQQAQQQQDQPIDGIEDPYIPGGGYVSNDMAEQVVCPHCGMSFVPPGKEDKVATEDTEDGGNTLARPPVGNLKPPAPASYGETVAPQRLRECIDVVYRIVESHDLDVPSDQITAIGYEILEWADAVGVSYIDGESDLIEALFFDSILEHHIPGGDISQIVEDL